ncbi:hypothetical protein ABIA36_002313 [Leifsonia sp. EB34]
MMGTAGLAVLGVQGPWSELDATSATLRDAGRSDGRHLK